MRPKKRKTTGSNDLFRAPLEQIINLKHELVLLAGKIDWDWIDREIAPLYSENGRSGWQVTARPIGMARKRIAARALIRQCRGSMDRRSYPLIANSHPFPSSDPECTVFAGDERLGRRVPWVMRCPLFCRPLPSSRHILSMAAARPQRALLEGI